VTREHVDGSGLVRALTRTAFQNSSRELVAEIDLAFLVFLALGSLAALKHWQRGLELLCSCDALLASDHAFATLVGDALRAHLEVAPSDFFSDPLVASADDVLRPALAHYFESLEDDQTLFDFVQTKFALFDDAKTPAEARRRGLFDATDDKPVVVELNNPKPDDDNNMDLDDVDVVPEPAEEQKQGETAPKRDPKAMLAALGFPLLAKEIIPEKEDADMMAARVLDETPLEDLLDEAKRFLVLLKDKCPLGREPYAKEEDFAAFNNLQEDDDRDTW